ncbi:hypothetical protein BDV98DRAFT_571202 [Pterulicium gracile]|uniref:Uncharacterized protein n=1 Tax=Pterulicium gracile TaxID=1884261 RepID=A0A5C3QD10_9AGAR|nr:hypothetical protein BDV98DRAFT_571202 [Pterula gracilis]
MPLRISDAETRLCINTLSGRQVTRISALDGPQAVRNSFHRVHLQSHSDVSTMNSVLSTPSRVLPARVSMKAETSAVSTPSTEATTLITWFPSSRSKNAKSKEVTVPKASSSSRLSTKSMALVKASASSPPV